MKIEPNSVEDYLGALLFLSIFGNVVALCHIAGFTKLLIDFL